MSNSSISYDDKLEQLEKQLTKLQNIHDKLEKKLIQTVDEDEILKYKFEIKKLKNEDIPNIQNKIKILTQKQKEIEENKRKQEKEKNRKEKLVQELYVKLDDTVLIELCQYFSLAKPSIVDNLREIVDKHSEEKIFKAITKIENELNEEAKRKEFYNNLYDTLTDHDIALFANKYPVPCIRPKVIEYLIDNFTEDQIQRIKIELYEQEKLEEKRRKELEEQKRKEAEEMEEKLKQIEKEELRQRTLREIIKNSLTNDEINLFLMEHHFNSVNETIEYLAKNFKNIKQIRSRIPGLIRDRELKYENKKIKKKLNLKKQKEANKKFKQEEKRKKESIKLKYDNIRYLGMGRYKYSYIDKNGNNNSITTIVNSIEELKLKVIQMGIPWNPNNR